jgi:hypothetical protein
VTAFRTEFDFVLPRGYLDDEGNLHRDGQMRLATAADEMLPLRDPRVQSNPAYLVVILLSRVITRLGSVPTINPKVIEGIFASDLAYLQDIYNRINGDGTAVLNVTCPHCEESFEMEPYREGGSLATPSKSSTGR